MRNPLQGVKNWVANWLIRRYTKGMKLSDSTLDKEQRIADLQRELNALKLGRAVSPNAPLSESLIANLQPSTPLSSAPTAAELQAVQPAIASMPPRALETPPSLTPPESPVTPPAIEPLVTDIEPAMSNETPINQEPTPSPAPAASAPRAVLPDVKMLAPILKIALATLSIEQMVEIGLHVKMGAPGFQQFLESDIAKVKFRELYGTYCEFLAGKVK
jgi:hypothetical protein